MFTPTLEEAKQLSAGHTILPMAMELFSDRKTSVEILKNLQNKSRYFFILESVSQQESWGRYSFLGYSPSRLITCTDGVITEHSSLTVKEQQDMEPLTYLRSVLAQYSSPKIPGLPPFTGGLVGSFAYDLVKYVIPGLKLKAENQESFPDFTLMLVDRVIAFDHFKQKIYMIVNVETKNLEENYIKGIATLKDMEQLLFESGGPEPESPRCGAFSPLYTEEEFSEKVERIRHHIREGDIFQAVISNCFSAECEGSLLQTYRILRTTNPSPYMVYLHMDDMEIVCASPETLVTLRDGTLSSYPLAGTRPRGTNEAEDRQLAKELLSDPKELSEHDMLVDLARNDLGKISDFGTVTVEEHRNIKRLAHVQHIASRVTGKISPEMDALDAIAATLPAGTLSGAPKKRACEIIDELEGRKRGPYGGAMGYLDFTGNMDLCIGIRMAVLKNGKVSVQAGAGIVADSVAAREYEEIQNKAKAVLTALSAEREERI